MRAQPQVSPIHSRIRCSGKAGSGMQGFSFTFLASAPGSEERRAGLSRGQNSAFFPSADQRRLQPIKPAMASPQPMARLHPGAGDEKAARGGALRCGTRGGRTVQ